MLIMKLRDFDIFNDILVALSRKNFLKDLIIKNNNDILIKNFFARFSKR